MPRRKAIVNPLALPARQLVRIGAKAAFGVADADLAEKFDDPCAGLVAGQALMQRQAYGKSIFDQQNTQFKLAELSAHATAMRVFTDRCIELFMAGKLDPVDAAKAKMLTTELHCRAADECLQLFGGWGYMWEMPIARAYADARITKIAGGSIEIMKLIIARRLAEDARRR